MGSVGGRCRQSRDCPLPWVLRCFSFDQRRVLETVETSEPLQWMCRVVRGTKKGRTRFVVVPWTRRQGTGTDGVESVTFHKGFFSCEWDFGPGRDGSESWSTTKSSSSSRLSGISLLPINARRMSRMVLKWKIGSTLTSVSLTDPLEVVIGLDSTIDPGIVHLFLSRLHSPYDPLSNGNGNGPQS